MLGILVTPPVLQTFVQFHIIAPFSNKINPQLKKFFGFFNVFPTFFSKMRRWPEGKTAGRLVKENFCRKKCGHCENATMRKNWKSVAICRKALCQRKMYNPQLPSCGKGLWKSLWKMWKSSVFPQVNRNFANPGQGKSLHKILNKPAHNQFMNVLRHRRKKETWGKSSAKKFKIMEYILSQRR